MYNNMKFTNTWKRYHTLWTFIIVLAILIGSFVLADRQYGTKYLTYDEMFKDRILIPTPTKIHIPTVIPSPTSISSEVFKPSARVSETITYLSLDKTLSFNFQYSVESTICEFHVKDSTGKEYDMKKLIGYNTGKCVRGPAGTSIETYIGWRKNKLLLSKNAGEIIIVNFQTESVELHKFDYKRYHFVSVDNNLSYWLFTEAPVINKKLSYVVLDNAGNVVKGDMSYEIDSQEEYSIFFADYDEVNNGYLFISRLYKKNLSPTPGQYMDTVSNKFDFLDLNTMDFKTLLMTDFKGVVGTECGSDYLKSVQGEIILVPACIVVNKQYVGSDGYIHIPLTK